MSFIQQIFVEYHSSGIVLVSEPKQVGFIAETVETDPEESKT